METLGVRYRGGTPDINTKNLNVDTDVNTRNVPVNTDVNTKNIDVNTSSNFSKFDPDDASSWAKVDLSDSATRAKVLDAIKKLETDTFTKQFKDVVTSSSLYKNNKGKLATMGLTAAGVAGWFGVLLAMGHSIADAWRIIQETINGWVSAAAGAAGGAAGAAVGAMWKAFVLAVHNAVGYKVFDDVEGTDKALKSFLLFLLVYKILGFFGINLVTLPFKALGLMK